MKCYWGQRFKTYLIKVASEFASFKSSTKLSIAYLTGTFSIFIRSVAKFPNIHEAFEEIDNGKVV